MIVILFASGDQDILILNVRIMTGFVVLSAGDENFSKWPVT